MTGTADGSLLHADGPAQGVRPDHRAGRRPFSIRAGRGRRRDGAVGLRQVDAAALPRRHRPARLRARSRYDGRELAAMSDAQRSALRRTEFGFVFQFGQLVPELTCLENVALPLRLDGVRRKEAERARREWLERLEVDDVAGKRPGEVSGGQGQRVAVARSLVTGAPRGLRRRADRRAGLPQRRARDAAAHRGRPRDRRRRRPRHPRGRGWPPTPTARSSYATAGPATYRRRAGSEAAGSSDPAPRVPGSAFDRRPRGLDPHRADRGRRRPRRGAAAAAAVDPGALRRPARPRRRPRRHDRSVRGACEPAPDTLLDLRTATRTTATPPSAAGCCSPRGPDAPVPPGLTRCPRPGEMVVSPALRRLLTSPDGALLRERLPYAIVGHDRRRRAGPDRTNCAYYAGATAWPGEQLVARDRRIDALRLERRAEPLDPVLLAARSWSSSSVLLMPVGVFIAAAVRFGGERRDRRLAALRLVGADAAMTRRIAAGEACVGALLGLVARRAGSSCSAGNSPGDRPVRDQRLRRPTSPRAGAGRPDRGRGPGGRGRRRPCSRCAGSSIEPLGVVRTRRPPRRRLWWRLLLPLVGLARCSTPTFAGRAREIRNASRSSRVPCCC